MGDEHRFDRLESKIDKLTDAVTEIARVEEKLLANDKRLDRLENQLDKMDTEIQNISDLTKRNAGVASFADKLFWSLAIALISLVTFLFRE